MVSMLAVRDRGRTGIITTLLLPVAATVSFTLAALTRGSTLLRELVFLAVMFVAVYIRRFGPRALAAGMAAFIGYFLTLGHRGAAVGGARDGRGGGRRRGGGVAGPPRAFARTPDRAWQSGLRALRARVHTLLHAVDDAGAEPDSLPTPPPMHDELLRLNATSLSLASGFDALDALPDDEADDLRRRVLDVELAAGSLVAAVDGLPRRRSARPTGPPSPG